MSKVKCQKSNARGVNHEVHEAREAHEEEEARGTRRLARGVAVLRDIEWYSTQEARAQRFSIRRSRIYREGAKSAKAGTRRRVEPRIARIVPIRSRRFKRSIRRRVMAGL